MTEIIRYSELYPGDIGRVYRMKDNISDVEHDRKADIISYLVDGGRPCIMSTGLSNDVFTGECTGCPDFVMTDDVYEWGLDYAYYVDKYNLMLPDDFIDHILRIVDGKDE